jgi:predicted peroxiredoxin
MVIVIYLGQSTKKKRYDCYHISFRLFSVSFEPSLFFLLSFFLILKWNIF